MYYDEPRVGLSHVTLLYVGISCALHNIRHKTSDRVLLKKECDVYSWGPFTMSEHVVEVKERSPDQYYIFCENKALGRLLLRYISSANLIETSWIVMAD